jgi:AraC family transcriptional regulator, transcriptional activator of the genes for pyochelin and ferripyochelin receptors
MRNIEELKLTVNLNENKNKRKFSPLFYISEKLKKAFKNEFVLRDGLKLVINEYSLKKQKALKFEIEKPPLEFIYCLSGEFRVSINSENISEEIFFKKGMNALIYYPESKGEIIAYPNEPIKIISLHLSPKFLNSFVNEDNGHFPDELTKILNGKLDVSFALFHLLSIEMQNVANSIFNSNYKNIANNILLEAKSLELISLHLSQVYELSISKPIIDNNLVDLVAQVKQYLIDNLCSPPSIIQLSEIFKITHTKLNQAFKDIIGKTVFEYLRDYRLDYSKHLLEDSSHNITEISYIAGWSSPAHFSREFKNKYGINPKKWKI